LALVIAVISNVKGFINPSGSWCFINRSPNYCEGDECHHENLSPYITAAAILYIFLLLFATAMMIAVCLHVRWKSKDISNFLGKKKFVEESKLQLNKIVNKQCLLFTMSLYIGFGSSLAISISQYSFKSKSISFQKTLCNNIMASILGILITIVYEMTRYRKKMNVLNASPGTPSAATVVADIRRKSIGSAKPIKNVPTDDALTKEKRISQVKFSIFDGSEVSSSPWAEFLHTNDESDDESNHSMEISNNTDNEDASA